LDVEMSKLVAYSADLIPELLGLRRLGNVSTID
jgi:hypothetical protein